MEPNKSDSKNKEPEKKESKGEEPEKKEYNYIEAKSLYTYEEAKKLGNQPWLIDKFVASPAYKEILDFIYAIQSELKGMKKSKMPPTNNECLLQFDNLFNKLEEIYNNNPPKKDDSRFDDPVFKRFHEELCSKFDDIMNTTILSPKFIPKNIIIELKTETTPIKNNIEKNILRTPKNTFQKMKDLQSLIKKESAIKKMMIVIKSKKLKKKKIKKVKVMKI